ncbi:GTPase [Zoogloeaceae bacteirum Par-f-2]|nr:GTPase [Zoogloeaceae bacteirum Par-f-2]
MNPEQTRALLTIALMAAFADGHQDAREREHVRRVAESLSREAEADFISLYQDVLLRRVKLEEACAALDAPELRQLAFETAVGVCDADGHHSADETAFLERLAVLLGLDSGRAHALVDEADALADAPVEGALPPAPADLPAPPSAAGSAAAPAPDQAGLDRMILNAAILNGALELLPQSLASWAIIPLQTRLVYRIGKAHGYELDRGHITDFLATIGVGLTSQYVEQFGRKLIGGLLGKVMGKTGRAIGSAATGVAFSFASTWALGQVAKRYYGGGRKLDAASLKQLFAGLVDEARGLQARYQPQIEERARTLDLKQLTAELRG